MLAWIFTGMGLAALVWFLFRVLPKPSRAAYPCQRVAFPVASSFVVWLLAVLGSAFAWRKARERGARLWRVLLWAAAGVAGCVLVVASMPSFYTWAGNPAHLPVGVGKGIYPGRVVWVHAPGATRWDGYNSPEHWYESNHCDLATVERMMSSAIQSLGGGSSEAASWDAIFRSYNQEHGKGNQGYTAGEKIAIKINLTTCNGRSGSGTVDINGTYEKNNAYDGHWLNSIDTAPQLLLSVLRQLVYGAGVPQTNIYVGDPTGNFPKYLWDRLHPEFPDVVYFDNYGRQGRARVELSAVPFHWSVTNANNPGQPLVQDYVPAPFAEAAYLINIAIPKSHGGAGVTVCGKNFFGAMLRCPDGYFRDANGPDQGGTKNYSNMHSSMPSSDWGPSGMGHYRCLVDLMGHPALGGKTLLCIGDMLFSGQDWSARPYKWNMAPFNGNWPSSILVSQDQVALDSVGYDFLVTEWPSVVDGGGKMGGGAEDYLHEAAMATNPPSGTVYDPAKTGKALASLGVHDHWNNPIDKQYSRNLDPVNGTGIELVAINLPPVVSIAPTQNKQVLSWQGFGYELQTSTNLTAPSAWWTLTTPPPAQGLNLYTNSGAEPMAFYRVAPIPPPPPPTNTPYGGTPLAITTGTTRLQAENFDDGGEGTAYHDASASNEGNQYRTDQAVDIEAAADTGGGYNIGWTATGEWLKYTVDVTSTGTYTLRFRVAGSAGTTAGPIRVLVGGADKTGNITLPNTGGWQNWTDVTRTGIALTAGRQVVTIELLGGGFNLNWVEFTRTGP